MLAPYAGAVRGDLGKLRTPFGFLCSFELLAVNYGIDELFNFIKRPALCGQIFDYPQSLFCRQFVHSPLPALFLFIPPCGVSTFALNNQPAKRLFPFLRASRGLRGKTPYFVKPLELVNLWLVGFSFFPLPFASQPLQLQDGQTVKGKISPSEF